MNATVDNRSIVDIDTRVLYESKGYGGRGKKLVRVLKAYHDGATQRVDIEDMTSKRVSRPMLHNFRWGYRKTAKPAPGANGHDAIVEMAKALPRMPGLSDVLRGDVVQEIVAFQEILALMNRQCSRIIAANATVAASQAQASPN